VKPDAVQVELGEPSEDASARHGEAVEAQEERDGGGLLEAGEHKDATLRGLVVLILLDPSVAVKGQVAGDAARGGGEPDP